MKTILSVFAVTSLLSAAATTDADAVVYCKYIGWPKGCVAKPGVVYAPPPPTVVVTPAPVVVTPAPVVVAPAPVVATPGVGAPGVGVRPGTPMNRGGPVNRVGRR